MTENTEITSEEIQKGAWVKIKKILKWVSVVLIILLTFLWWVGSNEEKVVKMVNDWRAQRYDKALQKYEDELKAKYTADTDGGKTPEETIDLFIAALKAGDIEKASKYYVLEKQQEELRHLKEDILGKYGDLQMSIDFYSEIKEKGVRKCNDKGDGCTFEYEYVVTETKTLPVRGRTEVVVIPAGEKSLKSIDIGLNHFSGVWKIELP